MDARSVFEILIREHADMLMAFIRSTVRDGVLADDIFQETLLTAWRRLSSYDKSRPFGPWLRGIAGNTILAASRQHKKVVSVCDEELIQLLDARCELLARRADGDTLDEKLNALRDCVQSLPDAYREVIEQRMHGDEESSPAQADRLGLNLDTWKKRLQRARARLIECLHRKLSIAEAAE